MIGDKATKRHRDRKSSGSAEVWRKRKKALNAARPKQIWGGGPSVAEGGFWTRKLFDLDMLASDPSL